MEHLQNILSWLSNFKQEYNTPLLVSFYSGFALLILGSIFRARFIVYLEENPSDMKTEIDTVEEVGEENEEDDNNLETEIKYLSEKVEFLEELFSTLNSSHLDYIESNDKTINSIKTMISSQNKVIVSHGDVLSKIVRDQSINKDKIAIIEASCEAQRNHLHEMIKYMKEQETDIQLIMKLVDKIPESL